MNQQAGQGYRGKLRGRLNSRILVATVQSEKKFCETIAQLVASALKAKHQADVDFMLLRDVETMGDYDAVVIGNQMDCDNAYTEFIRLLEKHQSALRRVPVAYFVFHPSVNAATPDSCEVTQFLKQLRKKLPQIEPVSVGIFGTMLNYGRLSGLMRQVVRIFGMVREEGLDKRAIRVWTDTLGSVLRIS